MRIQRVWAMPCADTFDCPPIGDFVKRYLRESKVSIDPFARNKRWATYTNDLNPNTQAEYHMDALDFLRLLKKQGIQADLVILDPPYSLRQIKEVYDVVGKQMTGRESTELYGDVKDEIETLLLPGGVGLCFGWNSIGMGKTRGYEIEDILLVCHGRAHNDTICVADRKISHQEVLL